MSTPRRLAALLTFVLTAAGSVACNQPAPEPPSSTVDATGEVTPSASEEPGPGPGDCADATWRTTLTGPLSGAALDPSLPFVVVGDGATLRSLTACGGERAGTLPLTAPVVQAPVVGRAGAGAVVFVTIASGAVVRVDIDPVTGALSQRWRTSLVRDTCPAGDKVSAAPAFAGDVVYVGTEYGCGAGLANRVIALNASTGAVLWSFNEAATYAVGAIRSAPVPDPANNRVLVAATGSGSTLFAVNMLNGSRLWSAQAGSLAVAPLLAEGLIVTGDQLGDVRGWPATPNSASVSPLWTVHVAGPVEHAMADFGAVDVVDSLLLIPGGGVITPVTYEGVARPAIALPTGQASTAPLANPSDRVFYVGAMDGGVWQVDPSGVADAGRTAGAGAAVTSVCCPALVSGGSGAAIVVATADGALARFAAPWPLGNG